MGKKIFSQGNFLYKGNPVCVFLLALGSLFRLQHFWFNRSLWLDEAYVAQGVSRQSFGEILSLKPFATDLPLPPVGFLLTEKLMVEAWANNEYVLRLFPLICGLASLFMFYRLAQRYIPQKFVFFPVALFAFSEKLIYYSAEVKPYSAGVFFALLMLHIFPRIYSPDVKSREILAIGLIGLGSLAFSYFMIFILGALLAVGFWASLWPKQKRLFGVLVALGGFWVGAFLVQYFFLLRNMGGNPALLKGAFDHGYFSAAPWFSLATFRWIMEKFIDLFNDINKGPFILVWIGAFAGGIFHLIQKDKKNMVLCLPFIFVFGAGLLSKYPLGHRFYLFLLPLAYVIVSAGMMFVCGKIQRKKPWVAWGILWVLVLFPLNHAWGRFIDRDHREQSREVMEVVKKHYRAKDAIFMNRAAVFAFGYYHGILCERSEPLLVGEIVCQNAHKASKIYYDKRYHMFNDKGFLNGKATRESGEALLKRDLEWFSDNPRTWVLFVHVPTACQKRVLNILNQEGKMINSYVQRGASVFLFDLSESATQNQGQ
jgi:hypothetical protein